MERLVKEAFETENNSLIARKYNINPGVVCRWVKGKQEIIISLSVIISNILELGGESADVPNT